MKQNLLINKELTDFRKLNVQKQKSMENIDKKDIISQRNEENNIKEEIQVNLQDTTNNLIKLTNTISEKNILNENIINRWRRVYWFKYIKKINYIGKCESNCYYR